MIAVLRQRLAVVSVIGVLSEVLGIVGLALVGAGLWLVHPAAALVTVGVVVFGVAVLMRTPPARRGGA